MSTGTYPLQALLRLREEICSQRRQALAAALRTLEQAERALDQARQRHASHLEQLQRERGRLLDGAAGEVVRMQRAQSYLTRMESCTEPLQQAVQQAQVRRQDQDRRVQGAREALALAESERKVVEKNREAFDERRRHEALARAEVELEDLIASRRGGA